MNGIQFHSICPQNGSQKNKITNYSKLSYSGRVQIEYTLVKLRVCLKSYTLGFHMPRLDENDCWYIVTTLSLKKPLVNHFPDPIETYSIVQLSKGNSFAIDVLHLWLFVWFDHLGKSSHGKDCCL